MVRFSDSPPEFILPSDVLNHFSNQLKAFYLEQSYGKCWFTPSIIGPVQLNRPCPLDLAGVADAITLWAPEIVAAINSNYPQGLGQFMRIVYLANWKYGSTGTSLVGLLPEEFNGQTYTLSQSWCCFDSAWNIQLPDMRTPWTLFDYIVAHELGHGLGMVHGNGWDNGANIEYGDSYQLMGTGQHALHVSADYKEMLGWITPDRIMQVKPPLARPVRVTINAITSQNGIVACKIQPYGRTDWPYYVEFRTAQGYDQAFGAPACAANVNGIFIHHPTLDAPFPGFPTVLQSHVINVRRNPSFPWFQDGINYALPPVNGQTWADPAMGVTIGPVYPHGDGQAISLDVAIADPRVQPEPPGPPIIVRPPSPATK